MSRTAWALAALLIVGAGCGGGTDGTSVAPPTAPTPTPPTAPTPTPPPAPEPPGVPSSLRVSASGEDFVEWTWNAVEGADGYDVQFSLDKMFDSADEIIGRTADQTSYRRQPLPAGSTAFLRVRSASGSGDGRLTSDWSAHVSGMTPAPPPPAIEITPVGRGISVTSENQILLELMSEDLAPANPLDLAGRTLMFTPDGRGGYSREVRALDWEEEADDAERMRGPVEVELEHFRFPFAGREWDSFFYTRPGLISFGEPIPSDRDWPRRFGTMPQMFDLFVIAPTISALYKPYLDGSVYVSNLPDRMIVTFFVYDQAFLVYGREPKETFDFQIVLHSDGRIALNYGPEPQDPDEAFGDGIVGVFPGTVKTGLLGSIPDLWTAPFPRTSILWKPRSTRPPSPIACWSSSRQEVPSVPSRTRRSSTWWRSTTGILSLESPCSRTAAERPGGTPGQRTTAMSMTTGSACCSIQASSRVTPRLSALSLGQGIS